MVWSRTPLHQYTHDYYSYDPGADQSDEFDHDDGEDPTSYPIPRKPSDRAFQPTYVYDEQEAQSELRAQRRATRVRAALCGSLSVCCAVCVLACLGLALSSSATPRGQALSVLRTVERAAMVQFTITPKPHVVLGNYGRRYEETTDFYGFTSIRGQLFPYISSDQAPANSLAFNGWARVDTNSTTKYDIILSNHRGVLVMRSVPLGGRRRSRCLTFDDLPPLHNLRAAAERAFNAQDWSSFRMNCSNVKTPPVETVFAHIPFVFCPRDMMTKAFLPSQLLANTTTTNSTTQSQTVWIHGERLQVETVLVFTKREAEQAQFERTRVESVEIWGNATTTFSQKCPYLEAPLATYSPRSPHMLHELIGDVIPPERRHESTHGNATEV